MGNTGRRLVKATQYNNKSKTMKTRTNILSAKSEQKDPDMRDISETNRIAMTWHLFGL